MRGKRIENLKEGEEKGGEKWINIFIKEEEKRI